VGKNTIENATVPTGIDTGLSLLVTLVLNTGYQYMLLVSVMYEAALLSLLLQSRLWIV
jgi:hypothetical protein